MKVIAAVIASVVIGLGSFFAGSSFGSTTETKTKTVVKNVTNPVDVCLAGTMKKFGKMDTGIAECQSLTDAEHDEVDMITNTFVDNIFSE